MLRLMALVILGSVLSAASTALAGWLTWQAILYLIDHSR